MPSCGTCQGTLRPETWRGNAAKQIARSKQSTEKHCSFAFMLPIFDMWTEWHWIVLSQVARMATLLGEKVETGVSVSSSQAWRVQNLSTSRNSRGFEILWTFPPMVTKARMGGPHMATTWLRLWWISPGRQSCCCFEMQAAWQRCASREVFAVAGRDGLGRSAILQGTLDRTFDQLILSEGHREETCQINTNVINRYEKGVCCAR